MLIPDRSWVIAHSYKWQLCSMINSYSEETAIKKVGRNDFSFVVPKKYTSKYIISEMLEWYYLSCFRKFVLQKGYPCLGAQTAVNGKTYAIGVFEKMSSAGTENSLAKGLSNYLRHVEERPSNYMTYIAIFRRDRFIKEQDFEKELWNLLSRLHLIDSKNYEWSRNVSRDPASNNFSFSFMGEPFFLVGLHPNSSRASRKFEYAAIAFNLHGQFENLRSKGRYEPLKTAIRKKEVLFSGSVNPMLSDFGEGLEAPQYSGRHVSKNWKCPFGVIKK